MKKRTDKEASQLIEIEYLENSVVYRCSLCGDTVETSAYYKPDHRAMIKHAKTCEGRGNQPTELAIVPAQEWRAVQVYDEAMVEQLADRIKLCVPNGNRLKDHEALALAQIAVSTDLNPFVGELFYLPGIGPHIGIEGLRRKSEEQSTCSVNARKMTDEEIAEHNVRDTDVGRICELFRHDVLARAVEINKAAGEPIIPIRPTIGVGIWRKGDQVPKGKSSTWVADKRAEADARRKAFNIVMPFHDNGEWLAVADENGPLEVVGAETVRREAAVNAEKHVQGKPATEVKAEHADVPDFSEVVAAYASGERELPPWAEELREAIRAHPRASDALGSDNGMIQQLKLSAGRTVKAEQFRASVEVICGHSLEEVTFGEAAVLINKFIRSPDFEARVVGLLS